MKPSMHLESILDMESGLSEICSASRDIAIKEFPGVLDFWWGFQLMWAYFL